MKLKQRNPFFDILVIILVISLVFFGKNLDLKKTIILKLIILCIFLNILFLFFYGGFYINLKGRKISFRKDFISISKAILFSSFVLFFIFFMNSSWRIALYLQKLFLSEFLLWVLLSTLRFIEFTLIHNKKKIIVIIYARKDLLKNILKEIKKNIDNRWILLSFTESDKYFPQKKSDQDVIKSIKEEIFKSKLYFDIEKIKNLTNKKGCFPIFVIDQGMQSKSNVLDFISWCFSNGISILSLFNFYESLCKKAPLFHINNKWIWDFNYIRQSEMKLIQKRLFDISLSILLTPFALIIGILIAMIIKIESKGPALFIQERSGRRNKIFKMYKFRTMLPHKDDSEKWPNIEKHLITRFGHVLRRTGLDEIPQLINIFKGEMSFIGARPARPLVASRHNKKIPFFTISHAMPPGITGWSQIHQGTDTGYDTILERVKYNLYYVKHYSIFMDIYIFIKSIKIFFTLKKPQPTYQNKKPSKI